MIKLAITVLVLAMSAATSLPAGTRASRVPFVGCPSDGQLGPQPVPTSGKVPRISLKFVQHLAYYSGPAVRGPIGTLAPRGWHCVALYGSNGSQLIVTPERLRPSDFLSRTPPVLRGPGIDISVSDGGTSGRFEVVPEIVRYFPAYRRFVEAEIKTGTDFGILRTGPYPADRIKRHTGAYLRFATPAHNDGEGTRSWLVPGDEPIEGIRKIVGDQDEPDLVAVTVRLPTGLSGLHEAILRSAP